jgi:hypothetical protein
MTRADARILVKLTVGLSFVLAAVALCFGLPAVNSGPHDLKLAAVGRGEAVAQLEHGIARGAPGDFRFYAYQDEHAAREAIERRSVVGALIVTGGAPRVLVASAGGLTIAQGLRQLAPGIERLSRHETRVEDVVPYTSADPRGAGITSMALPLILAGILAATALPMLFPRAVVSQVVGAILSALLAGVVLALVLRFALESIDQRVVAVAGGLALGVVAISLPALGLQATIGRAAFAVVPATMLVVGNALSGIANSPAWLPSPWGTIGQLFPPGANATLLRSNAYFGGHGTSRAVTVLGCWTFGGFVLLCLGPVGARLRRRTARGSLSPATARADKLARVAP